MTSSNDQIRRLCRPLHNHFRRGEIRMRRFAIVWIVFLFCSSSETTWAAQDADQTQNTQILDLLKKTIDTDPTVPGVIAAIASKKDSLSIASTGLRKIGEEQAIEPADIMHLGSCTKPMTATLAAIMVDQGKLTWETTILDQLPKLAKNIHADYRQVTLKQLLQHRSGMPANAKNWWLRDGKSVWKRRLNIAIDSLQSKPINPVDTKYLYSNLGYMVAGMMIGSVDNQPWEKTIKQRLFKPLGLDSAGFGVPGKRGKLTQPWGHKISGNKLTPVQHDNAPALGPAGTVHMNLMDWSRFGLLHIDGWVEKNQLIKPDSLEILHTCGREQTYGMGWIILERSWGKGQVLTHSGSNTMWYCTIWVAPNTEKVYLVALNVAGGETAKKADNLIGKLIALDRRGK